MANRLHPILRGIVRGPFLQTRFVPNFSPVLVRSYSGKKDQLVEDLSSVLTEEMGELSDVDIDLANSLAIYLASKKKGETTGEKEPFEYPYSVVGLENKAKHYLKELDLGQASEKAFAAIKLRLREYVKEVGEKNSFPIIPNIYVWDTSAYHRLINLFDEFVDDPAIFQVISSGWDAATICHIQGWNIGILTEEAVKRYHSRIFDANSFIDKLDSNDSKAFKILSNRLFTFNAASKAEIIAKAYDQYKREESPSIRKINAARIYDAAQVQFTSKPYERGDLLKALAERDLDLEEILNTVSKDFLKRNMERAIKKP